MGLILTSFFTEWPEAKKLALTTLKDRKMVGRKDPVRNPDLVVTRIFVTDSRFKILLTLLAFKANLDQLDAIFLVFHIKWQALLDSRGKYCFKLLPTPPNH